MQYFFLEEDLKYLEHRIDELRRIIRFYGEEMGKSCEESSETYHDNFAYEDGERQQRMWSDELRRLISIRVNAVAIKSSIDTHSVAFGNCVTITDLATFEKVVYTVGSYIVGKGRTGHISYNAPMAKALVGAEVGEICELSVGGEKRTYRIEKIE